MATVAAIVDIISKYFWQFWISISPQCLPRSFGSIWFTIQDRWGLKIFKMATLGGHLRYQTRTILAFLNLYVTPMPPIKFGLNPLYGMGGDVFWRISRWPPWQPSWTSEWNKFSSSESLCLHVPQMPPTKFQLNPTYRSRADVISRFSSWPPVIMAILDIGMEPI